MFEDHCFEYDDKYDWTFLNIQDYEIKSNKLPELKKIMTNDQYMNQAIIKQCLPQLTNKRKYGRISFFDKPENSLSQKKLVTATQKRLILHKPEENKISPLYQTKHGFKMQVQTTTAKCNCTII